MAQLVKQKRVVVYMPAEDYNKLQQKLRLLDQTVSGWFRGIVRDFLK